MSTNIGKPHKFGFRVIDASDDNLLQLVLVFYDISGNLMKGFIPHRFWHAPVQKDSYPKLTRAKLLAEAFCRYLNDSGNLTKGADMILSIFDYIGGPVGRPSPEKYIPIELDEGYSLVTITQDTKHSSIYRTAEGKFLEVVEDEYTKEIDKETVAEIILGYSDHDSKPSTVIEQSIEPYVEEEIDHGEELAENEAEYYIPAS